MKKDGYSNREIDLKLSEIQATIVAHRDASKEQLDRIEVQTIKTNGRVGLLERWQSYVIGFCAAITMLLVPIIISFAINSLK